MSTAPSDARTFALLAAEAADRLAARRAAMPWREWLANHFGRYTSAPFAERHVRFWEWITGLQPGVRPRPRVEAWPRGGGKSSTIELGCAWLGAQPQPPRHYVLYVSKTQALANKHVQSIAAMLERVGVRRATNEYGSSRGWRHEEIRTATGFNVTAFGLDTGMRGVKLDEFRPDVIVFDDIDDRLDSRETIRKKVEAITTGILPAGSADCAVIVVQNMVHEDSIVAQLCDGRADFLHDRLPATVEPAVSGLEVERVTSEDGTVRYAITAGTPTWAGQDLAVCEQQINAWGLLAFEREAQHEVASVEGGLWSRERDIEPFRLRERLPELARIVVAIDPNTSANGDEAGIIVAGYAQRGDTRHGYVLADRTVRGGPETWAEAVVAAYHAYQADEIVAEVNNGGDMVRITIGTISDAPKVKLVHASRGKRTRAEPVQKLYADGRVHHADVFHELEKQMCSWQPGQPSPDRMDALVWALSELMLEEEGDVGFVAQGVAKERLALGMGARRAGFGDDAYSGPLSRR